MVCRGALYSHAKCKGVCPWSRVLTLAAAGWASNNNCTICHGTNLAQAQCKGVLPRWSRWATTWVLVLEYHGVLSWPKTSVPTSTPRLLFFLRDDRHDARVFDHLDLAAAVLEDRLRPNIGQSRGDFERRTPSAGATGRGGRRSIRRTMDPLRPRHEYLPEGECGPKWDGTIVQRIFTMLWVYWKKRGLERQQLWHWLGCHSSGAGWSSCWMTPLFSSEVNERYILVPCLISWAFAVDVLLFLLRMNWLNNFSVVGCGWLFEPRFAISKDFESKNSNKSLVCPIHRETIILCDLHSLWFVRHLWTNDIKEIKKIINLVQAHILDEAIRSNSNWWWSYLWLLTCY